MPTTTTNDGATSGEFNLSLKKACYYWVLNPVPIFVLFSERVPSIWPGNENIWNRWVINHKRRISFIIPLGSTSQSANDRKYDPSIICQRIYNRHVYPAHAKENNSRLCFNRRRPTPSTILIYSVQPFIQSPNRFKPVLMRLNQDP